MGMTNKTVTVPVSWIKRLLKYKGVVKEHYQGERERYVFGLLDLIALIESAEALLGGEDDQD